MPGVVVTLRRDDNKGANKPERLSPSAGLPRMIGYDDWISQDFGSGAVVLSASRLPPVRGANLP